MNQPVAQAAIRANRQSGRWVALAALMAAQFMVVIDIAGLNVALPSIQRSLHVPESNLQWVLSAYQILFGGFLLLGGRIADLWGRKRMFMIGVALFALASLLCGLAWSPVSLVVFRGVQGLAAALLSPTSLSTVTRLFPEGRDRNVALGVWGAVFGAGGAIGSLLSGVITTTWGWSWFFFINLPLGAFALLAAPRLLPKDVPGEQKRGFNIAGAAAVSAGMLLLLYTLNAATGGGSTVSATVLSLVAAFALLAVFVLIQQRSAAPLVPPFLVRKPTMRAGIAIGIVIGACHFSLFFLLTLYMQDVLHLSPLQTSLGYLAAAANTILFANLASRLIRRFGVKAVLTAGMLLVTASLLYFSRASASGSYFADLFPALIAGGIGWGLLFPSVNIMSFSGVEKSYAGIAAGIVNMSEQLGGALGLTAAAIVAGTWTERYAQANPGAAVHSAGALTAGFHTAFLVLAGLSAIGAVFAAALPGNNKPAS